MEPCKTGILAYRVNDATQELEILHYCGYWHSPLTPTDFEVLNEELRADPEFAINGEFLLIEAPQDLVDAYNKDVVEYIADNHPDGVPGEIDNQKYPH